MAGLSSERRFKDTGYSVLLFPTEAATTDDTPPAVVATENHHWDDSSDDDDDTPVTPERSLELIIELKCVEENLASAKTAISNWETEADNCKDRYKQAEAAIDPTLLRDLKICSYKYNRAMCMRAEVFSRADKTRKERDDLVVRLRRQE